MVVVALVLVLLGYRYLQYRHDHIPVEATIIEHIWTDDNRLVFLYKYEVDGVSYIDKSGRYGDTAYGRGSKKGRVLGNRQSADNMERSCPVGSNHTVYYQKDMPWISHFETYW